MKNIVSLSFLIVLFNFSTTFGQIVTFFDDFENGINPGWTHYSDSWGTQQTWQPSIGTGVAGSNTLTNIDGPFFGAMTDYIITPANNLYEAGDPMVSFDLALGQINGPVRFSVEYATSSSGPWIPLETLGDSAASPSLIIPVDSIPNNQWTPADTNWNSYTLYIFNLSQEHEVYIRFGAEFLDANTNGAWFLDNVQVFYHIIVEWDIDAIPEPFYDAQFSIFPNPTQDILQVNTSYTNEYDWSIVDITGNVVQQQKSQFGNTVIDLGSVAAGVYILQLESEGQQISKRLIRQ
jgi:hypothetical protein